MSRVLLITSGYYAEDIKIERSPVINYFAREWVKQGHEVIVYHVPAQFPGIMRKAVKPFAKKLEAILGSSVNCDKVYEREYVDDNVPVYRVPLNKTIPHSRYPQRRISYAAAKIVSFMSQKDFAPDIVISHFVNPGVEIMKELKAKLGVPTCVVLHGEENEFNRLYGKRSKEYLHSIDVFGFRSKPIKDRFERINGNVERWFYCYSGIPESFLSDINLKRDFNFQNKFIYAGSLIRLKNVDKLIDGVVKEYSKSGDFSIAIIGRGKEETTIRNKKEYYGLSDEQVRYLGYLPREAVREEMRKADVFIMISSPEAFGLVYLEAMSVGTIPIASRGEGFDGILKDGYNGFLCNPGDSDELASIIKKIRNMSASELQIMSDNAKRTALSMTDEATAKDYLENVFKNLQ